MNKQLNPIDEQDVSLKGDMTSRMDDMKTANALEVPDLRGDKRNCCGCGACYSICPVEAIAMAPDEKGFYYPVIDEDRCIRCYQCVRVCAFKKAREQDARGQ